MTRRKGKGGKAANQSATTDASTPDRVVSKKSRNDGNVSAHETILSNNPYSVGTAVNDSDLDGFGEEANGQQDGSQLPTQANGPLAAGGEQPKVKMPPLVVKKVPVDKLAASIAALGVTAEYKLSSIGTKVLTSSKADYDTVAAALKNAKAEFFSHDIPGERPFKVVIRGLPNIDPKAIETELRERFKLDPTALYRMIRRDENVKKYPDCLYLVHFKKGTVTLNALQAIRTLFQVIIRWETYRGGHRDVTQCQRCLNFGHGTRNCNIKPRCNNCAKSHATADCPAAGAAVDGTAAYKCANCGGSHQGSDRKCAKREDFKRIRKMASTTNQPGRRKERPPAFRAEEFPPLPGKQNQANQRTNETPHQASPAANAWHRRPPTAEATQPNQTSEESLLSDDELVLLVSEVLIIKRSCKTRSDQLRAVISLINKYGN